MLLRKVGVQSTAEIAKELGIGPLEVRKRVNELLEDIDVLTVQQERTRLLIELRSLVNRATERLDSIGTGLSDREFAQVLNSTAQTIRVHLQELDKMESKDDEALKELNRNGFKNFFALWTGLSGRLFKRLPRPMILTRLNFLRYSPPGW